MTLSAWLALALVCLLGAMSPGHSLAIVVRHSLCSGTRAGVICALSHGFGIFLWAALPWRCPLARIAPFRGLFFMGLPFQCLLVEYSLLRE